MSVYNETGDYTVEYQVVLVCKDGDTKTCIASSELEAKELAKRVDKKYPGTYIAAFLPERRGIIPTQIAKEIAEACK